VPSIRSVAICQADKVEQDPSANGSHDREAEAADTEQAGIRDEPEASNKLEDPEVEDIKTITAGDTMYSSAKKFEDLPISEPLLQVV